MNSETFLNYGKMRGWPYAQMLDYMDSTDTFTISGFEQYQFEQDESDRSQFKWDAQQHRDPVMPKDRPVIIPSGWCYHS